MKNFNLIYGVIISRILIIYKALSYLALTTYLLIDRIILNEDRHYNNLGIIVGDSGYRVAPIFDNGKSLLVGNMSYTRFDPLEEKVKKVIARPFSGSHRWQYEYFKEYADIVFNKKEIVREIDKLPASDEKEVALYQLSLLNDNRENGSRSFA